MRAFLNISFNHTLYKDIETSKVENHNAPEIAPRKI